MCEHKCSYRKLSCLAYGNIPQLHVCFFAGSWYRDHQPSGHEERAVPVGHQARRHSTQSRPKAFQGHQHLNFLGSPRNKKTVLNNFFKHYLEIENDFGPLRRRFKYFLLKILRRFYRLVKIKNTIV